MSAFSDYVEGQIIDAFLRGGTYNGSSALPYVALFGADPTDVTATAIANEASYTNYARQSATFTAGSNGVTQNTAQIDFPANGDGVSATVTHVGIFDASTAGNLLFHAPLTSSKTLQPGDVLSFATNALQITVA
jgi:hypothetical protein